VKHLRYALIVILSLMLAVSGCAPAASVSDTVSPEASVSTAPTPTAPALHGPYSISNYTIYNGQNEAIYDAAAYYDENLSVWVSSIIDDGSALYLIECAATAIGDLLCGCDVAVENTHCALVRIDGDGGNRKVLLALDTDGLVGVQPFAGRVFFVQSEEALASVGWVDINGGDPVMLSLPAEDGGSYCYDAALSLEGDSLVITARYYNENTQSDTTQLWRIGADLSVTAAE